MFRKEIKLRVTLFATFFLLLGGARAQSQLSLKVTALTKHGHPVSGVALTLAEADRVRVGSTNGKGGFEFTNLGNSTYVLEASYLDFPIATIQDIRLQDPGSRTVSIMLDPPGGYFVREGAGTPCMLLDIGFVPDGGGRIVYKEQQDKASVTGRVGVFDRSMKAVADGTATVAALRTGQLDTPAVEVPTNDRGEFHFDDLEPGKYRLRISRKGSYTGTTMDFWVARQNTTHFGLITMYPEGAQDMCGSGIQIIPFDDPATPGPEPELIDPNQKR